LGGNYIEINVNVTHCPIECSKLPECTHFTWKNVGEGVCSLREGTVDKYDAFFVDDPNMVCGIRDIDSNSGKNQFLNMFSFI
jgi:hypothetical protein